jgi:crotonobetainyl-CoA:carnitine CoA-transferase CaiB-like acyl-CoA transferase
VSSKDTDVPEDVTSSPPFAGVRVLDFSGHFAAAMAAMHLGDLGAEVIKIDPSAEERGRREPGYLAWNRNKKRLVLDLARAAHLKAAKELVSDADVAIFDAAPGALEPLGLDGVSLTRTHDHLVHAWAPPYGERGRWSALPASHGMLAALTGIAFGQPSYSGVPVHLVSPQAYYGQANCLATAIGAALFERAQSGHGQRVTVSGLHGATQVMPSMRVEHAAGSLWGAPLGGAPNYRLYQCADGEWLFLGALFEPIYLRALEVTGVLSDVLLEPQIDGDLRAALVGDGARMTMAKLEDAFRGKTRAEWLAALESADVPSGPVRPREDWFRGATVAANDMRVELPHAELGTVEMPGVSLRMSATPPVVPRLAEALGGPDDVTPRSTNRAQRGNVASEPPRGRGPLAGVRVLDLGMVIAGAYAGAILAGLGADVVKIETASGDPFRAYGTGFCVYNRGKRALVLDLKREDAKATFFELVAQSDVVLDNSRLGVRERLGITYERLREINPRIISLSISGYGTNGLQASQPGFDPLLQAQSGLMRAQGGEGSEPVFHRIAVNDVGSAAMSAYAIVAALFARMRTGEGQELHTSLASQSVLLQIGELTSYQGAPRPPTGAQDCIGVRALERYYECADGWIAIACMTPAHYHALVDALDLPPQDADEALDEEPDGTLARSISEALRPQQRDDALGRLRDTGTPVAPVLTIDETYTDAFLEENGYYDSYVDPTFGAALGVAMCARFERTNSGFERPAPTVGQHTDEVLRDFGLSPARVDALVESGASWRGSARS